MPLKRSPKALFTSIASLYCSKLVVKFGLLSSTNSTVSPLSSIALTVGVGGGYLGYKFVRYLRGDETKFLYLWSFSSFPYSLNESADYIGREVLQSTLRRILFRVTLGLAFLSSLRAVRSDGAAHNRTCTLINVIAPFLLSQPKTLQKVHETILNFFLKTTSLTTNTLRARARRGWDRVGVMEEGDRNASDDFVALTNTKLTHSLPSIRQRALESLHFKLKHNLLPVLAVTSNEDVLENVLLALDSETRTNIGEDDSKRSLIVAILTTIVRKSTKQELFVFQRTMRKIRGEGVLRRIAMDCKLTNGKEWMSEEIEHYFKAKRRAMVMNVGRENYQENDTDEDEEYDVVRESFNAKEEEIRRRLKRYEDEEMRTSTRNEQTVNRIAEVPRMVKCVSSDGSFGRRLVSRRRQHSFNDEEKKNEYDILRKHLTQYERTLKTTTNVDVLLGVLRALRENILSDWGVQAFAFANPESGIVRAACDILVSSSNSRHSRNGAEDADAGEEDFLNLDRSVVSLKREALLFLADVALGLKSALYENRSDSGSGSSNSYRANAEISRRRRCTFQLCRIHAAT